MLGSVFLTAECLVSCISIRKKFYCIYYCLEWRVSAKEGKAPPGRRSIEILQRLVLSSADRISFLSHLPFLGPFSCVYFVKVVDDILSL